MHDGVEGSRHPKGSIYSMRPAIRRQRLASDPSRSVRETENEHVRNIRRYAEAAFRLLLLQICLLLISDAVEEGGVGRAC